MTKRDIKFRQWSERNQEMTSWEFMKKHNLWVSALEYESLVTEQYTGLKDVNGVEIYEGDYLANERGKSRMIFKVEWFNGAWWVIPVTQYGSSQTLSQYMNRTVEIIGNVHQNPELLEV